jgi:hypothetical protein
MPAKLTPSIGTPHAHRAHLPVPSNQGVLHFGTFVKYSIACPMPAPRKVFDTWGKDVSLHSDPRQFGTQRVDLHLLGGHLGPAINTFQTPFPMRLDPLNNVCSTRPNVRDIDAILWPDSND